MDGPDCLLLLRGKLHGQPLIVEGGLLEAVQQQLHVGGALEAGTQGGGVHQVDGGQLVAGVLGEQAGVHRPVGVDQEGGGVDFGPDGEGKRVGGGEVTALLVGGKVGSQGGLVVAEEDQDGGPLPAVDVVGQPAQHLVGGGQPLDVGGNGVQIFLRQPVRGDGEGNILPGHGGEGLMILHGDGKEEGGLLRPVQQQLDVVGQGVVGGIAPAAVFQGAHGVQLIMAVEGIEAQVRVGAVSGVEAGLVGVQGHRPVARVLVVGHVALQRAVHIFVGGGPVGQHLGAQAGEDLKLRADRPAADGVGVQRAAVAVVPAEELVIPGEGVLAEGEAGQLPQVAEALAEHQNHVEGLLGGRDGLIAVQQALHIVPGVAAGRLEVHVVQIEDKGAEKAVFLIIQALEHGKFGVDGKPLQQAGDPGGAGAKHNAEGEGGGGPEQMVRPAKGQTQAQQGQSGAPEGQQQSGQGHVFGQASAEEGQQGARLPGHEDVLGKEGVAIEGQLHGVDKGDQEGGPAGEGAGYRRPPHQEQDQGKQDTAHQQSKDGLGGVQPPEGGQRSQIAGVVVLQNHAAEQGKQGQTGPARPPQRLDGPEPMNIFHNKFLIGRCVERALFDRVRPDSPRFAAECSKNPLKPNRFQGIFGPSGGI